MSPGLSIELHAWRGIGPSIQRELFFYSFRLGFVTVAICKHCVIDRYRMLRDAVAERVEADERRLYGRRG